MFAETARSELFTNIASGAESGWDFSTRWFAKKGPMADQLTSIRTTSVVPVDLNAILCQNEATLAFLNNITGKYRLHACSLLKKFRINILVPGQ